jgi:hypothetical protein
MFSADEIVKAIKERQIKKDSSTEALGEESLVEELPAQEEENIEISILKKTLERMRDGN